MRKLIYTTLGPALLALALITMATPGKADVVVIVTYDKTVDINVDELIDKLKIVDIDVDGDFILDGAAEAEAVVNATNNGNNVDGSDTAIGNLDFDFDIFLDALIETSITTNSGIVGVNQENGNMVNQGNVVSLSVTGREPGDGIGFWVGCPNSCVWMAEDTAESSIAHSQAEVDQSNRDNVVFNSEFLNVESDPNASDVNKNALITGSINDNAGIVGVNQSNGNMSNQHNVVSMAIGFGAVVALSEAALGQENTNNLVTEIETVKVALINGSVNGNTGIVSVNQDNGNMNNQSHVVSMSALTSTVAIGVPGS